MKFMHSTHSFNDLKLKYKLALIIFIVSVTITSLTFGGFNYVIKQYNKLLYEQTANSLSFVSDELMYNLRGVESVTSYISYDSTFQENLDTYNTTEFSSLPSQKARTNLISIFNRYYTSDMVNLTLFTANDKMIWWGKTAFTGSKTFIDSLISACDKADGRLIWRPLEKGSGILCARKILEVKNLNLKPMGYLIIQVDLDDMVHNLLKSRYANGQQFQVFISSEEKLLYPTVNESYLQYYKNLFSESQSYAIKKIDRMRMFITFSRLPIEDNTWRISLAIPYDNIFRSLNRLIPTFMFSLLLAVFIATALAGHMIKNISYQFNKLVGKMDRIKLEGIIEPQTSPITTGNSQDEMTVLNAAFDQMIVELKKLIEESYVKELLITQAQLKSLEQQVNPHFLYNTLNSINWLAKKSGSKDISTIAQSLGSMLQSSLSNRTVISMKEELEIVSCFVKIQQIRFDDLVVTMEVDPSTLAADIPKMTIQPLVENAILHAQEELQDEYVICLSVTKDYKNLIKVQVENSGSFIDTQILEHLKNETVKPKGNGIGLLNIDSRLRILFGEDYHLSFDNKDNMAIVSFTIPQETETASPHLPQRKEY